jgi:uncharacterized protein YbjT (DUF2867 family)
MGKLEKSLLFQAGRNEPRGSGWQFWAEQKAVCQRRSNSAPGAKANSLPLKGNRMRILIVGGTGLIGSAITASARSVGYQAVVLTRSVPAAFVPNGLSWVKADMAALSLPQQWLEHLGGIDAVVNCAGILQDAPGDNARQVHSDAVKSLVSACQTMGVRRFIHFSAVGVDREAASAFSRTKKEGDAWVGSSDLDWVILRPSVVLGRAAYGGSAAFRGLAALPVLPILPHAGLLQVVRLEDVVATVMFFLREDSPSRVTLELVGPERLSLSTVVGLYRQWLGWRPARLVALSPWAAAILYGLGDVAGWLGWRPPLRSTARLELRRGAIGDPGPWTELTGIRPRRLAHSLAAEPATIQERWFALLYFLKPIIIVIVALFWTITGLLSLGPGYANGVELMQEGGAGRLSGPSVIAGGFADLAIGLAIFFRRAARYALWTGIGLAVFYAMMGTLLLPRLWIEPLGPLLKIWPIVLLMAVALAVLRDR